MIDIDDSYHAPMQEIPLDDPFAVEWLERLAKGLPYDLEFGIPLSAVFDPAAYCVRFRTTLGTFFAFHGDHAERLVRIGEGAGMVTELTSWFGGRETQRTARRSSDVESAPA